jgi:hypothetical protein
MAMYKNGKDNFTDALAMDVRYALLTKSGRIQVLVKPTAKQLRKRGKRGWHLFRTIESQADAPRLLEEIIQQAVAEVESGDSSINGKKKKSGRPKASA